MKKTSLVLFLSVLVVCTNAKVLRVSNINGSTAPYSSVSAALEVAVDGDVIMVDASPNSYGDIEINKKVTLQGPGYSLRTNGIDKEGAETSEFGNINLKASGAKVSSVYAYSITCSEDKCVVTRCNTQNISLGENVKGCVVHQNMLRVGLTGNSLGRATNVQVTNNIFNGNSGYFLTSISNSSIKYNTFRNGLSAWNVRDCVIEYNIGAGSEKDNTYDNNMDIPSDLIDNLNYTEAQVKELWGGISASHGAFAGEDPYVISGLAPGPYIEDIYVPVSVEQGTDMNVTLKISTSR